MFKRIDKVLFWSSLLFSFWIAGTFKGEALQLLFQMMMVSSIVCLAVTLVRGSETWKEVKVCIIGVNIAGMAMVSEILGQIAAKNHDPRPDMTLYFLCLGISMIAMSAFMTKTLRPAPRRF
ncbi:MAG: hypothetical protein WA057_04805 [Candidatus Magasanikiibacteriota bacterium]